MRYGHPRLPSFVRCVLVLLVLGLFATTAWSAKWVRVTSRTKLKVGQRVQVLWHGEWIDGTISSIENGHHERIRVRIRPHKTMSHTIDWPFERSEIRVQSKRSRSSKSSSKDNPFELGSGNPFEPEKGFRKWKDDTGQFEIEAELVKIEGDAVRLKRRDGRTVTVPIDRLCEADRKIIERLQSDDDDEEEDNGDAEDTEFLDQLPLKDAQCDRVQNVFFGSDVEPKNLQPDGCDLADNLTRRPVTLPPKEHVFDRAKGLYIASLAPHKIMLPYMRSSQHDQPTRIVVCDLSKKTRKACPIKFPVEVLGLAFGPSGDTVLSCPNRFGFGKKARADLWKIEDNKLKHQFGWEPYRGRGHGGPGDDVEWAAFVDNEHVLTCSGSETLVLWKLPEIEAVYSVQLISNSRPVLSPGHKQLAVLTEMGLAVLDAKTGEVLGNYRGADKRGILLFRPDGKRIALLAPKRLMVWDLNNQVAYRDIGLQIPTDRATAIAWPAKNYILVENRYLVDLEKYAVLWEYQGVENAASIGRQFWFLCSDRENPSLIPQSLPHLAAKSAASQLDGARGLEPGRKISLEINVSAPSGQIDKIRSTFKQQLADRGFELEAGRRIKLVISTKLGKSQKVDYVETDGRFGPMPMPMRGGPFGRHQGKTTTVNFREQISEVAIVIRGETAWQCSYTVSAPNHIAREEGQSVPQLVRSFEKPNLDFFTTVQIPAYVALPRDDVALGASKISSQGLRPAKVQSRKPPQKPRVSPSGDRRA